MKCKLTLLMLFLLFTKLCYGGDYYVLVYGGIYSDSSFLSTDFDLKNEYLQAIAIGKEFWNYTDSLDNKLLGLELEGQLVNHTGNEDSFKEFVVASNVRLHELPWERIKVTVASGIGLSLATTVPDRERKDHSNANQLLCYLMYEATFSLPKYERWSLVPRMHHRSGIFGLFDGVHGGSNYPSLGIKYNF